MRITQSNLTMQSSWASVAAREERVNARAWITPGGIDPRERPAAHPAAPATPHVDPGQYAPRPDRTADPSRCGCKDGSGEQLPADARMALAVTLLERLLGRRLHLASEADLQPQQGTPDVPDPAAADKAPAADPDRPQFGMVVTTETTTYEAEQAVYRAQGSVRTQDGRTIDFAVDVRMAREKLEHSSSTVRLGGAAKDPLVISLDGRQVTLTADRTNVDLDADGQVDHVPIPVAGQGYLVRDLNGNGRVDDGHEIVGAISGDGFADLRAADQDGNGWVDEGDSAWASLKLWTPAAGDGPGTLRSLADVGIGALATGSAATPITLEAAGEKVGAVRGTSVALTEDGRALAVSQVDVMA